MYFESTTYQGPLCSNHRSQGYDSVHHPFFQWFFCLFVYTQLQLCEYVVRTTCAACERIVVTVDRAMTTLVSF